MTTYNSTSYTITSPELARLPIGQTSASVSVVSAPAIGTIVTAKDPTYGEGTFIYLNGVANTAVGSVVTFNSSTGVTALATTSTLNNALAVATAANTSSTSGAWYQVAG